MELKSVFSIVLPIIHNYKTHNDMKKLDSLFLNCPLKRSSQLFDSPLLGVGSPLLACLELRQSQRHKAGVHQNENHTYLLKRGNIPFTVGKIKLWVYKGGIGFITIDVSSGPLCDSILLDLIASLSNVITRLSIIYEQAVARGSYKTVNTSIQQIMENICGLTEYTATIQ